MYGVFIMIICTLAVPMFMILWNRQRTKGRLWCLFVRKDKSVDFSLCELKNNFVVYKDRAYDVYPDFIRVVRFPIGWPKPLQELVPVALYDEEDAIPLDWVHIDNRLERAMELRAALDENWLRKLVVETSNDGSKSMFNWRKVIPILLIGGAAIGLIILFTMKGCS